MTQKTKEKAVAKKTSKPAAKKTAPKNKKSVPPKASIKDNRDSQPEPINQSGINLSDFPYTLDDVIGQEKAIEQMKDLLITIRESEVSSYWSIKPVKGILFEGASGTGKTMTARAFVKELGNDVEMHELKYLDIASRWIDAPIEHLKQFFRMIEMRSQKKHVVVFIDEFDGMIPSRESGDIHETSIKRVDVFLEWLDGGLSQLKNITLIGATNYLDGVDKAAIRPGRFDAIITFEELDAQAFTTALEMHFSKYGLNENCVGIIDWTEIKNSIKEINISGAAAEQIVKKIVNLKSKEHLSKLNRKYSNFSQLTSKEKNEILVRPENLPSPISTQDFIEAIKNYLLSAHYSHPKQNSLFINHAA